jgi:hypothetical protein
MNDITSVPLTIFFDLNNFADTNNMTKGINRIVVGTGCVRISKAKNKKKKGSSLFCMGNSISLLSAEADYMRGMLNVERP